MGMQGKGLLFFFADVFWRDYLNGPDVRARERFLGGAISNKERMRLLANCSQIIFYLKGDVPLDNDVIEALIWAVSEYGHEVLGIEPRLDIQSHLLRCARTEPELHVLKEYYRDHFFHCLEVCFLGHFLLELRVKGEPLLKKVGKILRLNDKEVLRLWYITALLHDVGYLMDALTATNDALEFFENSGAVRDFRSNVQKALDGLSRAIDEDDFAGYTVDDKPGEDHGVISALHLEALLKNIARDNRQLKVEDYRAAIRAIAAHNSRKHTVSFVKEPIGFLLIVCDTIQEWVRPRLLYSTAPVQMLTWLMGQGGESEHLTGPFRSLTFHQVRRENGVYHLVPTNGKDQLFFSLEYGDGINKNSGVFNLWLDATYNLQRLDMAGLGFEIDVEYITPYYRQKPLMDPEQQFHRLQDAVKETHMEFVERWFPRRALRYVGGDGKPCDGVTNDGVTYIEAKKDDIRESEHLVLHLRQLCKNRLISGNIDEFRKRLKTWRHYNDDREFAGDYAPAIPK
jgi:hypothetical protein